MFKNYMHKVLSLANPPCNIQGVLVMQRLHSMSHKVMTLLYMPCKRRFTFQPMMHALFIKDAQKHAQSSTRKNKECIYLSIGLKSFTKYVMGKHARNPHKVKNRGESVGHVVVIIEQSAQASNVLKKGNKAVSRAAKMPLPLF